MPCLIPRHGRHSEEGGSGKEGGARRGHLGVPSATWLWLRLVGTGSLQRAIMDDRPDDRARGSPDVSDDAEGS